MDWKSFVRAGDAIFTVAVPETVQEEGYKPHYTYRVQYAEAKGSWPECFFVKLLVGPSNTDDYVVVGKLSDDHQCVPTRKSMHQAGSPPIKLLNRVLYRVFRDELQMVEDAGFKLHHEGRCGCCGRTLTTPESVETGIGPVCRERMGLEAVFGRGTTRASITRAMEAAHAGHSA